MNVNNIAPGDEVLIVRNDNYLRRVPYEFKLDTDRRPENLAEWTERDWGDDGRAVCNVKSLDVKNDMALIVAPHGNQGWFPTWYWEKLHA